MIAQLTKYGISYETPVGLDEKTYYEMIYEFVDFVKTKGLTIKQAQKLFSDCSDAILHTKLNW